MSEIQETMLRRGEGEYKVNPATQAKGRVHKGTYGSGFKTDEEGNELGGEQQAPQKRGRGRPKKVEASGPKYNVHPLLTAWMGGGKTRKESVESIKAVMLESIQQTQYEEIDTEEQE